MNREEFTDEQLLSYVIGDLDAAIKLQIEETKLHDKELAKRITFLSMVNKEVKSLPLLARKRKPVLSVFCRRLAFSLLLFGIGLYTESKFNLIQVIDLEEINSTEVYRPFTWNESHNSSLM